MVLLLTSDEALADTLSEKFRAWGMRFRWAGGPEALSGALSIRGAQVVLLDVRNAGGQMLQRLGDSKPPKAAPKVILLNRPDNITASMAGMKAGAADEINEPFCAETLRKKVQEASAVSPKGRKRGLLAAFTDAMSAAAMAHGGHIEAALEIMNDSAAGDKESADHKEGG